MTVRIKKDSDSDEDVFCCVHEVIFYPKSRPLTEAFLEIHQRISGKPKIHIIDYYPESIRISVSEETPAYVDSSKTRRSKKE